MSATNSTTHYSLPSFLGSDKPAWLVDWNGAMATIDSAIYEAKQAADTASASATAVASDLATLSGTVSTQGSTISTLSDTLTTAVGNINTINGNITTINSLIGNGTPTTTDQTIIGAINEINAKTNDAISDIDSILNEHLLWTNSSPTTAFADQTIALDLSDYHALEIEFKSSISSSIVFVEKCYIDSSLYLASAGTSLLRYRTYTPSSTGIQFDAGKTVSTYGTATDSNDFVLPLKIRGIV